MSVVMEQTSLRFAFITAQAEKQIEKLPAQDRRKVVNALGQPLRRDRCKKMNIGDRYWRLRVTDSVRVAFLYVDGQPCVVHVGTHQASDRFVDHANGSFKPDLIPLEES